KDLSLKYNVTAVDIDQDSLNELEKNGVQTINSDLSDGNKIKEVVAESDLVIGAVPGFLGYNMAKSVIEAGKDLVDISFFPEDPFQLDELAKKNNVTVITDCGVAPGLCNILLGAHYYKDMKVNSYTCYVGGLPKKREWPYEYKAVFSPIDVIEEYIRPARLKFNGEIVTKEALSDAELIDFDKIGTLEAFNTDGLRTLLETTNIPNMTEKTLRYPGCIEYLKVLRESGYFSYEEVDIKGSKIKPIELTSKLLFPKWQLKDGETDFTIMRVIVEGEENGNNKSYTYELYDEFDQNTGTISMARTTGFTCNAAADAFLFGKYENFGINPPEYIGSNKGAVDHILEYLKDRGVEHVMN
ncbi:MAG: saccharopine dehydrogenase family protein, partial [Flavobacteriales bacterium]